MSEVRLRYHGDNELIEDLIKRASQYKKAIEKLKLENKMLKRELDKYKN
jgi:cell division protein FtsB